jgi:hypothetical protein
MMPCGPLSDDWLYWDPQTIDAYPHSPSPGACRNDGEPEQLDLFTPPLTPALTPPHPDPLPLKGEREKKREAPSPRLRGEGRGEGRG